MGFLFSFSIGSNIGTLTAHDMDEKNSVNSILVYKIAEQTPRFPEEGLFLVQTYSGIFQLAKHSLRKQDTPKYHLVVNVSDKG